MKKSKAGIGLTEVGEQNKTKRFYLRGTLAVFCLSLAFFVFAGLFSFSPEARELFYVLPEEGCGSSQIDLSKDPKIGSAPEISIIEKIPEFAGDALLDANRTLHNSFNSFFLPRCYEVKRDGRISWVQKDFGINAITDKLQGGAE